MVGWKVTSHVSLLNRFDGNALDNGHYLHILYYKRKEMKKYQDWKRDATNELMRYTQSGCDALQLITDFCKPCTAHYYHLTATELDIEANLDGKLPKCLKGKVQFGDIVEIDTGRTCTYVVNDVAAGSLFKIGPSAQYIIHIPSTITDELCDPIEFYRVAAPAQEPFHCLDSICFSFGHRYIQRLLGITSENKKDFNCALFAKWKYFFDQENQIDEDDDTSLLCSRYQQPMNLRIVTDIDGHWDNNSESIWVPTTYANDKEHPLMFYVQQVVDKRLEGVRIKKELNIQEEDIDFDNYYDDDAQIKNLGKQIPSVVYKKIRIMNLFDIDDSYGLGHNAFEQALMKPASWSTTYPSIDFSVWDDGTSGVFVGLQSDVSEMRKAIIASDNNDLCYGIKVEETDNNYSKVKYFRYLVKMLSPDKYGNNCLQSMFGGYDRVIYSNINIAVAIWRGINLEPSPFKPLRLKILPPIATINEFKKFSRDGFPNQNSIKNEYLVHTDYQCRQLVNYLAKYRAIRKRIRKLVLSNKEYKKLMIEINKILN